MADQHAQRKEGEDKQGQCLNCLTIAVAKDQEHGC